jgi:hypothetical protein
MVGRGRGQCLGPVPSLYLECKGRKVSQKWEGAKQSLVGVGKSLAQIKTSHKELSPPRSQLCWVDLHSPYTQPMQTHSKMATKRRHIPLAA